MLGNETKLAKGEEEYLEKKAEYFMAIFMPDPTYKNKLDIQRQLKEKEFKEKYNMTIEEFFLHSRIRLNESRHKLESYRPLLADGEKKFPKEPN